MAKMSVLDLVSNILNAMDSDPVNSIDDTVESLQVAEILKESFYDLMSQRDWPFLKTLTSLTGLGDTNRPNEMLMQEGLNKVYWIKYNKKEVIYLSPDEFHDVLSQRVEQPGVVSSTGLVLNRDPEYWTTYDDKYVVFDGYNSSVDNTLQQSKSAVFGVKVAAWTSEDSFVPDIPEKFFPTLLAEAKAASFLNLKQQGNQREERKAQRGRVMLRNEAWRNDKGEAKYNGKVNYGRR